MAHRLVRRALGATLVVPAAALLVALGMGRAATSIEHTVAQGQGGNQGQGCVGSGNTNIAGYSPPHCLKRTYSSPPQF
jgi:hypothetical protein